MLLGNFKSNPIKCCFQGQKLGKLKNTNKRYRDTVNLLNNYEMGLLVRLFAQLQMFFFSRLSGSIIFHIKIYVDVNISLYWSITSHQIFDYSGSIEHPKWGNTFKSRCVLNFHTSSSTLLVPLFQTVEMKTREKKMDIQRMCFVAVIPFCTVVLATEYSHFFVVKKWHSS